MAANSPMMATRNDVSVHRLDVQENMISVVQQLYFHCFVYCDIGVQTVSISVATRPTLIIIRLAICRHPVVSCVNGAGGY